MKIGAEAAGDLGALTLPEFRLDGQISATDGAALVGLLGLDRALNVDKRAGTLSVAVRSAAGSDARVDARLNAGGLAASANGTARLFHANGLAAALDVTLQAADASPLRRGAAAQPAALLPVALRAKLNASANEFALDEHVRRGRRRAGARQAQARLRRGEAHRRPDRRRCDRYSGAARDRCRHAANAARVRCTGCGRASRSATVRLRDFAGRVEFTAARATLTPTLTGRQMRGTLRLAAGEIALENIEGTLAGGRASGQLVLRRGAEGLASRARLALAGADAAAMLPGEGKAPLIGRLGLQADVEGSGLSPASLIGSLSGAGTITLEDAQISGLDPKAFNAAIRAVDQGLAVDAPRIRDIVATVLDGGRLAVPRLDAALAINAGQARIGQRLFSGRARISRSRRAPIWRTPRSMRA